MTQQQLFPERCKNGRCSAANPNSPCECSYCSGALHNPPPTLKAKRIGAALEVIYTKGGKTYRHAFKTPTELAWAKGKAKGKMAAVLVIGPVKIDAAGWINDAPKRGKKRG